MQRGLCAATANLANDTKASQIWGISPTDPWTFGVVTGFADADTTTGEAVKNSAA
jgi:hypothetical protein